MRDRCRRRATPQRPLRRLIAAAGAALAIAGAAPLPAAPPDAAASGPLTVESVRVTPTAPGPAPLCQLHVVVRNAGPRPVSHLAFRVTVEGVELPAYSRRLFMARLEPGASRELRLFNFWAGETGRPVPSDGQLDLEVALVAARWIEVTSEEGVETWAAGESVDGLPARAALSWRPEG